MSEKQDPFHPLLPKKPGDRLNWGNVPNGGLALLLQQTANQTSNLTIVITPDFLTANKLERELKAYQNINSLDILSFPDWETLPYDNFSPHRDIISSRMRTLSKLPTTSKGILIVPITTLMHNISPNSYLQKHCVHFEVGQTLNLEAMRLNLTHSGYQCVSQVTEHGEFAIRGAVIDLFPMSATCPIRIDLFDNEIESLRQFDPNTQRTTEKCNEISLYPAREFPLTPEAISQFRTHWHAEFSSSPNQCPIYQSISQGLSFPGAEYYLPLFFDDCPTLIEYFPEKSCIIRLEGIEEAANKFWDEVETRYEQYQGDITRPILAPNKLFVRSDQLFAKLKSFPVVNLSQKPRQRTTGNNLNFNLESLPDLSLSAKIKHPLNQLEAFLKNNDLRVIFCAESAGRREVLLELLEKIPLKPTVYDNLAEFISKPTHSFGITVANVDTGVLLPQHNIAIIAEADLYGEQVMQRRRRKALSQDPDVAIKHLTELTLGAPVVHIDFGVGRYQGLKHITTQGIEAEFLVIEYAKNDKLYIPVSSLHLISQYSGMTGSAPLHRLGTDTWEKAKQKAAKRAYDVAAELLDVYAKRAAQKGYAHSLDEEQYFAFAKGFPFEETLDQQNAIQQVTQDMLSDKPMDRLVCGDVGFGKTEVAMRAAFIAAQEAKQVAVLVPTTLLAQQHYETFLNRFADLPIRVEVLSRFKTQKKQNAILADLKTGKVDIVIGTHKLIQDTVHFQNLGLLVIDEEHRFGVKQKEKIKAIRKDVNILTLTATPIPRTLNMAISAIRDLSIISTPPAKRLAIKTFVQEINRPLITEAVMRELMRGGQIYYLHNNIDTIHKTAEQLKTEIPEARIAIAHGQMPERTLEKVMSDFYHQRTNLLVCTTIIENGIDVPTANTIIMDRADKLGLAQLHQLRGRVGRSHHQAYAYCFTPSQTTMTKDAVKRLEALESLEALGSGFTLASHDLEIRGCGELLGVEQSGNVQTIGFHLYMNLLERTINALKKGEKEVDFTPLRNGSEVDLKIPTLIPEDYLPDIQSRLILYKRIAGAKDMDALYQLQVEMIDRFGLLPEYTKNLFHVTKLKIQAKPLKIKKIVFGKNGGKIEFEDEPNIDSTKIIDLIQSEPHHYKLMDNNKLKLSFNLESAPERIKKLEQLLKHLA